MKMNYVPEIKYKQGTLYYEARLLIPESIVKKIISAKREDEKFHEIFNAWIHRLYLNADKMLEIKKKSEEEISTLFSGE